MRRYYVNREWGHHMDKGILPPPPRLEGARKMNQNIRLRVRKTQYERDGF